MVLLLLVGPQSVPPLPQDLADCAIVLIGMSLVHQGPVAFTENHECIHGAADVVLLPLVGFWKTHAKPLECHSFFLSFLISDSESESRTDLPVSIFGQGAQGLCASLDGTSGGSWIIGHTRGEPTIQTQK